MSRASRPRCAGCWRDDEGMGKRLFDLSTQGDQTTNCFEDLVFFCQVMTGNKQGIERGNGYEKQIMVSPTEHMI